MKKLTQIDLDAIAELLPILDEEDQKAVLGGSNYVTGSILDSGACIWTDALIDTGCWEGGYVDGMGYVVAPVSGAYVSGATSWWDVIKESIYEMIPDALTLNVSFDFSFLGGGQYEAGYAMPLKGPDAGNLYSFDSYSSSWGLHAEASLNIGYGYFTGKDSDFNFVDYFAGEGYSAEIDALGGISVGWGSSVDDERLIILGVGYGESAGAAFNWGHTNIRQIE